MSGPLFETQILSEILKSFRHRTREAQIYFLRTRDGQEIDFLIETDGQIFPIEVKMGSISPNSLSRLDKIANSNWQTRTSCIACCRRHTCKLDQRMAIMCSEQSGLKFIKG